MTLPTTTLPGPWPQQFDLWTAPAAPAPAPVPSIPPARHRSDRISRRQWVMEAYGIAPRRSRHR